MEYEETVYDCTNRDHLHFGSPWDKEDILSKYFYEDEDNPAGKRYKWCKWCRAHKRTLDTKYAKIKFDNSKIEREKKKKFITCTGTGHAKHSEIHYGHVPVKMFLKDPEDPNGAQYSTCKDCRDGLKKYNDDRREEHENAKVEGVMYCSKCRHEMDESGQGLKVDGTPSKKCIKCYTITAAINKESYERSREFICKLKFDNAVSNGACCNLCNCIFIKNDNKEGLPAIILKTELINDVRCVEIDGRWRTASRFIRKNEEKLELILTEFDHLDIQEQIERGLIEDEESYVPKTNNVSRIFSCDSIALEASKCQIICKKCHIIETVKREKGYRKDGLASKRGGRTEYANELKRKGCEICGYSNKDLLRFFDLDHINPETKISAVSHMLRDPYTLKDFKKECAKCRVLCGFCHRIHTRNQIKTGIIKYKSKK